MKQYLDERQSQVLGKCAMGSFVVMYIACAVAIVVQLYVGNRDLSLVLGETIIMLGGGGVYLYGVIKTGTFSANGICKGKRSIFDNISLSVLISAIFSIAYWVIINKSAKNATINVGKYTALFFGGIVVLCFVVLTVMGIFSDGEQRKSEKKYDDDIEEKMDENMNLIKVYMASISMEAEMLIEILLNCGINAFDTPHS